MMSTSRIRTTRKGVGTLASPLVLMLTCALALGTPAQADTIRVDPGADTSFGKVIIGSGQNLPSMQAANPWDIGSYPAQAVISYHNGGVQLDQADVATAAVSWTRTWLRRTCGDVKPATIGKCRAIAIFDVDDTLLSSYPVGLANDPQFSYDRTASDSAVKACSTPVIEATREAYRIFRSWGLATAIITGRPESQRKATLDCLAAAGMADWDSVSLKPPGDDRSAAAYKRSTRQALIDDGWVIGPSIGDQVSDMSYGALGRGFLMPNIRYFLP